MIQTLPRRHLIAALVFLHLPWYIRYFGVAREIRGAAVVVVVGGGGGAGGGEEDLGVERKELIQ